MYFHGELFGGSFPKDSIKGDVPKRAVQKGVYYSPNYHVVWYDVSAKSCGYATASNLIKMFEIYEQQNPQFLWAKPLVTGTLKQCIKKIDVETFESTYPEILGLRFV